MISVGELVTKNSTIIILTPYPYVTKKVRKGKVATDEREDDNEEPPDASTTNIGYIL